MALAKSIDDRTWTRTSQGVRCTAPVNDAGVTEISLTKFRDSKVIPDNCMQPGLGMADGRRHGDTCRASHFNLQYFAYLISLVRSSLACRQNKRSSKAAYSI